ncbi:hypothetical protein PP914_gp219 [Arthrobacter phage Qui]|uniref:Uncharacterized protein n=1 Tax=Arthrobacter phage Qui TaxID=2603260 RepID=A0A5B8WIW2_9CAUD|nr:hypothetical protein PP914_gp219 [Arthrobacter phage Qui]QED11707.1 hypothetical protein SEA_QUI_219 [Arthrobacter phage Qui]QOC56538.1 hypothetical protein SEA_PAELLA_219 [Arthrobacter phage Paella]
MTDSTYDGLPKSIKRHTVELELVKHHFDYSDVDMYMYIRKDNGKPYGDGMWRTEQRMSEWLERTRIFR